MGKQYFSKTKKRWMDFKTSDVERELRKYKYRIRTKPRLPTEREARIYGELKEIGASPRQADIFLKKHKPKPKSRKDDLKNLIKRECML